MIGVEKVIVRPAKIAVRLHDWFCEFLDGFIEDLHIFSQFYYFIGAVNTPQQQVGTIISKSASILKNLL